MAVREASADETPYGRYIGSDGWFVLNLADALAVRNEEKGGATYPLESRDHPFADVGVRVCVLWPGDPNALYHSEDAQEGFLVLSGECLLIVEGEEQRLRAWDFVHCPPMTRHVFVGTGERPCVVIGIGARRQGRALVYPVDDAALRHGAGVEEETSEPSVAYARFAEDVEIPCPKELPDL